MLRFVILALHQRRNNVIIAEIRVVKSVGNGATNMGRSSGFVMGVIMKTPMKSLNKPKLELTKKLK